MLDEQKLAAEIERLRKVEREKDSIPWRLIAKAFMPVAMWIGVVGGAGLIVADVFLKLLNWGSKR